MDDTAFDRLTKRLGATPTRRNVFGLAIGAAVGGFAGLLGLSETDAKNGKGKKKKKKGCPKKPCPKGYQRNKRTCKCECVRTPCSGGKEFDAESCRCRCPRDLRECQGECIGKDECCPTDLPCPEDPKGCCSSQAEVCTIDGCCLELDGWQVCNGFCIDTKTDPSHCGGCNDPCQPGEICTQGICIQPELCPDEGVACPGRTAPFCAPKGHSCCGDNSCNALNECCDPNPDEGVGLCCVKGRCTERRCCTGNREVCAGKCCDFGKVCCGDKCCSPHDCLNGSCCPRFVCGAAETDRRVCPATDESCCIRPDNSGYACPATAPFCAIQVDGCCPVDLNYRETCDACCPSILNCNDCVAPIAGRT